MKSKKRVVVARCTNPKGEILMGKRKDNKKWSAPGGHLKKKECPFEGMFREWKEETGVDAESINLVKSIFNNGVLVYLFEVECKGKDFNPKKDPDKEFSELRYVRLKDMENKLHIPKEQCILHKC